MKAPKRALAAVLARQVGESPRVDLQLGPALGTGPAQADRPEHAPRLRGLGDVHVHATAARQRCAADPHGAHVLAGEVDVALGVGVDAAAEVRPGTAEALRPAHAPAPVELGEEDVGARAGAVEAVRAEQRGSAELAGHQRVSVAIRADAVALLLPGPAEPARPDEAPVAPVARRPGVAPAGRRQDDLPDAGLAVAVADHVSVSMRPDRHLVAAVRARAADLARPQGAAPHAELQQERVSVHRAACAAAREPRPAEVDGAVEGARDQAVPGRVDVVVVGLVGAAGAVAAHPAHAPPLAVAGGEDVGAAGARHGVRRVERGGASEAARDHRAALRVHADAVGVVAAGTPSRQRPVEGGRRGGERSRCREEHDGPDQQRQRARDGPGHGRRNTPACAGLRSSARARNPGELQVVRAGLAHQHPRAVEHEAAPPQASQPGLLAGEADERRIARP